MVFDIGSFQHCVAEVVPSIAGVELAMTDEVSVGFGCRTVRVVGEFARDEIARARSTLAVRPRAKY